MAEVFAENVTYNDDGTIIDRITGQEVEYRSGDGFYYKKSVQIKDPLIRSALSEADIFKMEQEEARKNKIKNEVERLNQTRCEKRRLNNALERSRRIKNISLVQIVITLFLTGVACIVFASYMYQFSIEFGILFIIAPLVVLSLMWYFNRYYEIEHRTLD